MDRQTEVRRARLGAVGARLLVALAASGLVGCVAALSVRGGPSLSGFIKGEAVDGVSGATQGVEAVSGATRIRPDVGVRALVPVRGHRVYGGLEYALVDQPLEFVGPHGGEHGEREVRYHQVRLPLGYCLPLWRDPQGVPLVDLRAGLSVGRTVARDVTDQGEAPEYSFTDWDWGPEIGLSVYPLRGRGRPDLGVYLDLYRGSRVYEDYLHTGDQAGRNYYMRIGLSHGLPWGGGP